jgi:tight adherence protein B
LQRAARDSGGLGAAQPAVLAAARFGGDVPKALAVAARQPGADGLLGLAACWRVAVDQGAGLAAGLDRLEEALRADRDQRADLRAQLAGPRATAVMLACLPVVGLLLGAALGADPLHVLLHTGAGLGCLIVGGVLEGLGMWWALRIVRDAEAT